MKKVIVSGAVALACLFAVAAGALASTRSTLPTLRSDLIVPGKSLGGVQLYSSAAAAKREFTSGGRTCSTKTGCSFLTKSGSSFEIIFAITKSRKTPFVGQVTIASPTTFNTPLVAYKTAAGIGLGSTAAAVKRAYPHVKGSPKTDYVLVVRGPLLTVFVFRNGRVSEISLQDIQVG